MRRRVTLICLVVAAVAYIAVLLCAHPYASSYLDFLEHRRPLKAGTYYGRTALVAIETYSWHEPVEKVREVARMELPRKGWSLTVIKPNGIDEWRKAGIEIDVFPGKESECGGNDTDDTWTTVYVMSQVSNNWVNELKAYQTRYFGCY